MFTKLVPKENPIQNYSKKSKFTVQRDKFCPKTPSRILIVGNTNSGKTNLLCHLIYDCLYWDRIYVNAKDLTEDKYENLLTACEHVQFKNRKKPLETFFQFNNDGEKIVTVDELDKTNSNLIIFDDFLADKAAKEKINEIFIRSRKKNATVIYLSQSFFDVPKLLRHQCNYFIFFKTSDSREICNIWQNLNMGLDKETFIKVYRDATKDPYSFLLLDTETNDDSLKIRKNLHNGLML